MKWLIFLLLLLTQPSFASNCVTIQEIPHAKLERCDSMDLLTLSGSPLERAKANGILYRQSLSPDVLDYFSNKALDSLSQPWMKFLSKIFYNQMVRAMFRGTPNYLAEETDAFAAGAGFDPIYLRRALSLPDLMAIVNALGSNDLFRNLPAAGCTSIAKKDDEAFLVGRNLDFGGAELWDKHPLILVSIPEPGSSELKHISIGAHGIHFAGITGINEAGITFAVHQNYTKDASLDGIPMAYIGEIVLRNARTLDEALVILQKNRPASLWTFVLSNLQTHEAIAVEISQKHFSVRKMEVDNFVQTNHLLNQDIRTEEEFISTGTKQNSIYRMGVAYEKIETLKGKDLSPQAFAKILSAQENPEGYLSAYHDILKAHTIQTVIFSSVKNEYSIFVSAEEAPAAGGKFAKFSLQDLWNKTSPMPFEIEDLAQTPPEKRKHQKEISHAFHLFFDEKKYLEAANVLENHNTLDAALFRSVAFYRAGNFQESLLIAQNAKNNPRFLGEPEYILQSVDWTILSNLWRLNRREEAKTQSQKICEYHPINPRLKELCDTVNAGKIPHPSLVDISFEFFTGDLSGRAY